MKENGTPNTYVLIHTLHASLVFQTPFLTNFVFPSPDITRLKYCFILFVLCLPGAYYPSSINSIIILTFISASNRSTWIFRSSKSTYFNLIHYARALIYILSKWVSRNPKLLRRGARVSRWFSKSTN